MFRPCMVALYELSLEIQLLLRPRKRQHMLGVNVMIRIAFDYLE
jgi:hypothetical protein